MRVENERNLTAWRNWQKFSDQTHSHLIWHILCGSEGPHLSIVNLRQAGLFFFALLAATIRNLVPLFPNLKKWLIIGASLNSEDPIRMQLSQRCLKSDIKLRILLHSGSFSYGRLTLDVPQTFELLLLVFKAICGVFFVLLFIKPGRAPSHQGSDCHL